MAKQIVISFKNELIKVVYLSLNHGKVLIQKTLILRDEELDNFLKTEKTRHFTVVCDFKSFYQDILLLPPIKKVYLKIIIESEIRKKAPELKDFSFFHTILEEKPYEGRIKRSVFVFAVNNEDLFPIVDRFKKYNKTVKHLYPSVLALSHLVTLSENLAGKTVLYVMESGMSKILFLMNNAKLALIRVAQSLESGIHDFDVQNINMTINYCRQTLRLAPSAIFFIGNICNTYVTTVDFMLPSACIQYPQNIVASKETLREFIVPISAGLRTKEQYRGNLIPQKYLSFCLQKKLTVYCTVIFLLLSAIGLGSVISKFSEISLLKHRIQSLRAEMAHMEPVYQEFENRYSELQKFIPLVNFMNTASSLRDLRKALVTLECLFMENVNMHSIQINNGEESLRMQIKGGIASKDFVNTQRIYHNLLTMMKKNKDVETLSDSIDLSVKSFQIEAIHKKSEEMETISDAGDLSVKSPHIEEIYNRH